MPVTIQEEQWAYPHVISGKKETSAFDDDEKYKDCYEPDNINVPLVFRPVRLDRNETIYLGKNEAQEYRKYAEMVPILE